MAALTTKIRHITQTITAAFRHQPPAAACTICMEELVVKGDTNIKQLPCRHKFHASCIRDWLYLKQTCPICRSKIADRYMLVNTHLRVSFKEFKRSKFLWVYQLRELIDALFPEVWNEFKLNLKNKIRARSYIGPARAQKSFI
ncbi:putative zinc finger, RING/FYVE/PHD-type containing protein [Tanacetum coccineum]|uniref:Zinc finger, RING/FYVE/PHD-type containing protein n=1 Tax=Tanacetum coccineum TaxID=301880 RepID=A0ABQ4YFR1_9ASTR